MQIAGHGSAVYLRLIRELRCYLLCRCGVDRLEIVALQHNVLDELIALKVSDIAGQCNVITEVTVHRKDRHLILLFIPYSYGVYVCDICILLRVMLRGGKHRLQSHAASVFGCVQIRIVNRLLPCRAVRLGHDRCDNVYKLCQAGHLHTVRMLDHRDQKQSYNERILKGVMILEKRRSLLPRMILHRIAVCLICMEPHVPLIKAQVNILLAALLCLYEIAGGDNRLNEMIHLHRTCKEVLCIIIRIAEILMQRNIVHIIIGMLKGGRLPLREGRHLRIGASARYELDGRVDQLHRLCGLCCQTSVLDRSLCTELPRAVHLIAQAPGLDVQRILYSMADTPV